MAQFANFLAVPTERQDRSGYENLFENLLKGYQMASQPARMKEDMRSKQLANQIAQLQLDPENIQLDQDLKRAQIGRYNQPQRAPQSKISQAYAEMNALPEGPEKESYKQYINKMVSPSNGITVGVDPVTGQQTVQIGGSQSGLQKQGIGEEPYYEEDESGKLIQKGNYIKPSSDEVKEYEGRGFFNNVSPFMIDSMSEYSGKGANERFLSDINNFESDPKSRERIVNFLAAKKLSTAAAVKEASTLGAPNTQKTLNSLTKSIDSSDIPKLLSEAGGSLLLPKEAMNEASNLSLSVLNKATEAGQKSVPSRIKRLFDTEGNSRQKSSLPVGYQLPEGSVLMYSEDGKPHAIPKDKQQIALSQGYKNG